MSNSFANRKSQTGICRLDSFEPLVIGELVNRRETVPMAFSRGLLHTP